MVLIISVMERGFEKTPNFEQERSYTSVESLTWFRNPYYQMCTYQPPITKYIALLCLIITNPKRR